MVKTFPFFSRKRASKTIPRCHTAIYKDRPLPPGDQKVQGRTKAGCARVVEFEHLTPPAGILVQCSNKTQKHKKEFKNGFRI